MLRSLAFALVLVGCSSDYGSSKSDARRNADATEPTTQNGKTAAAAPSSSSSSSTVPETTAPAAPEKPGCKLDTRTVYVQDGEKIESITGRGRYLVQHVAADGSIAPSPYNFETGVADEPKFRDGPCGGRAQCVLDTRTVYFDGTAKVETITAYGSYFVWGFDANNEVAPNPAFPQTLEQTDAFRDGPCSYANGAACVFDTRALEMKGTDKFEYITAYGRSFAYTFPNGVRVALPGSGVATESIARFGAGPCKGQPANACVLDTLTRYVDLDGSRVEEVTARGRLWAYALSSSGDVLATTQDGIALDTIPRFASVCQK